MQHVYFSAETGMLNNSEFNVSEVKEVNSGSNTKGCNRPRDFRIGMEERTVGQTSLV
jgi:hypothetical protein